MNNTIHLGGRVTKTLETAAITAPYTLVKPGTTDSQVAPAGASDTPIGVALDEGAVGDSIAIQYLGAGDSSTLLVASATITGNPWVVPAADGKAAALSATPGTYEVIGRVIKAAAADELLEIAPCPHQRTVS